MSFGFTALGIAAAKLGSPPAATGEVRSTRVPVAG
jgi:hypothetical protein